MCYNISLFLTRSDGASTLKTGGRDNLFLCFSVVIIPAFVCCWKLRGEKFCFELVFSDAVGFHAKLSSFLTLEVLFGKYSVGFPKFCFRSSVSIRTGVKCVSSTL